MKKSLLISALMMLCGAFSMQAAVTVPEGVEIETYTGSATGSVRGEAIWDVQVAVDNTTNTMYVKNMLPGMEETGKSQWITGTIDEEGTVTFKTYQNAGYQKIKNTTYTYVEVFGYSNKKMVAATFSWDPDTKTLVNTNDEVQAYAEDYYMVVEKYTDFSLVGPAPITSINDIKVTKSNAYKTIENGQVVIVKDGVRYNMMGQKL